LESSGELDREGLDSDLDEDSELSDDDSELSENEVEIEQPGEISATRVSSTWNDDSPSVT
jgi:hypothetical protein